MMRKPQRKKMLTTKPHLVPAAGPAAEQGWGLWHSGVPGMVQCQGKGRAPAWAESSTQLGPGEGLSKAITQL